MELVGADAVHSVDDPTGSGGSSFDALEPGPVRLVVLAADGTRIVQTEWVLF